MYCMRERDVLMYEIKFQLIFSFKEINNNRIFCNAKLQVSNF